MEVRPLGFPGRTVSSHPRSSFLRKLAASALTLSCWKGSSLHRALGQMWEENPEEKPRTFSSGGRTRDIAKHSTPDEGCKPPRSLGRRWGEHSHTKTQNWIQWSAWTFQLRRSAFALQRWLIRKEPCKLLWANRLEMKATFTGWHGIAPHVPSSREAGHTHRC